MTDTRHSFPLSQAASRAYTDAAVAPLDFNGARPSTHGLLAWASDPINTAASAAITLGTLYLTRVSFRRSAQISKAVFLTPTNANTATTVEVSLFSSDGTRRALSANVAASFASTGEKQISFAAPYTPPAPVSFVWVGILAVGGTPFNLSRCCSTSSLALNVNLSAATSRFATAGTGLTATPASIVPANLVQPATANENWWTALL